MNKFFKKVVVTLASTSMVASLFAGTAVSRATIVKADNLLTGEWTHNHEAWQWNNGGWYDDAGINETVITTTENGFTADIKLTGWQAEWSGDNNVNVPDGAFSWDGAWRDKPYQLNSEKTMSVEPASTYNLKFDIKNDMTDDKNKAVEKNVTVTVNSGIENDSDNTFLLKTVRVPAGETYTFDEKFTVGSEYKSETVKIQIAYGAYIYSYNLAKAGMTEYAPAENVFAPGTVEPANVKGKLSFSNISVEKTAYEEITTPSETKPEVESKYAIKDWTHTHEPEAWDQGGWYNDAGVGDTTIAKLPTGFAANIKITGWRQEWNGDNNVNVPEGAVPVGNGWCDNPYQLTSQADLSVKAGHKYDLKFDISNKMLDDKGNPTEKNVTITVNSGIENDTDNVFWYETVRIPANETLSVAKEITIPETYTSDKIVLQVAYGPYCYSYEVEKAGRTEELLQKVPDYIFAPGTTEGVNSSGVLMFVNTEFKDQAQEEETTPAITENETTPETTTVAPTTKAAENNSSATPTSKTLDKTPVNGKLATTKVTKATKKKAATKVKLTFKKVNGAKKYQVQVSTSKKFKKVLVKKTVKKVTVTIKNKKLKNKKKLYVRVKAVGAVKWSKAKKVKIK